MRPTAGKSSIITKTVSTHQPGIMKHTSTFIETHTPNRGSCNHISQSYGSEPVSATENSSPSIFDRDLFYVAHILFKQFFNF